MTETDDRAEQIRRTEDVFRQNCWIDVRRQALHLEWEDLSRLGTRLLSGLLGRRIETEATRSDYYFWALSFPNAELADSELETLAKMLDGTEFDLDVNGASMFPIRAIEQGLCCKLFNKILPFTADVSLADDEGVWFISSLNELRKEN